MKKHKIDMTTFFVALLPFMLHWGYAPNTINNWHLALWCLVPSSEIANVALACFKAWYAEHGPDVVYVVSKEQCMLVPIRSRSDFLRLSAEYVVTDPGMSGE